MKRYSVKITLSDGSVTDAKVTARSENEAIQRVIATDQFLDFSNGKDIVETDVTSIPIEPIDDVRFSIRIALNKPGWYIIHDSSSGIRIEWKKGMFNETNRVITTGYEIQAVDLATILREASEYLYENFRELI